MAPSYELSFDPSRLNLTVEDSIVTAVAVH
jgi:hypothetical protein